MALPIDDVLPDIRNALAESTSLVILAPPGAGKTTRVPLAVLDDGWLDGRRLLLLEPRRLAARAAASWMALQLGEDVGATVGYRMRGDTRVGPRTRVEVVTEGVLTRLLQHDASLDGIGCVVFDEFHERSLHADTGLAFALESREILRPDLRIVAMSATLDGDDVARLLGGARIIRSEGRSFPVVTHHVSAPITGRLEDVVAATVSSVLDTEDGDVLVFLPGAAEIHRTADRLAAANHGAVDTIQLYGDLPRDRQQRAIEPGPIGRRKVVLATSIAETSLTIEGVRIVVDAGLMRVPRFSPRTGMTRLETVRVTRDSADQRRGRAGRTASGICHRLWTESEEAGLVPARTPEILEADLAPLALEIAARGVVDPSTLRWLDAPPAGALAQARELLLDLGAIDRGAGITAHGREIIELPAHPRIAHMMLEATRLGLLPLACDLAALIDERDVVRRSEVPADADIRLRLDALRALREGLRPSASIDAGALRRVRERADEWRRRWRVDRSGRAPDANEAGLLLAFGWPDRVGRTRGERGRFQLRNGTGVSIPPSHSLAASEWIVAVEVGGGRQADGVLFLGAHLSSDAFDRAVGDQVEVVDIVEWDRTTRSVRAERVSRLGALVLRRTVTPDADPDKMARALLDGIRVEGIGALPWSDASIRLRQRIAFLHTLDPAWPDLSDATLLASLEAWLLPWLAGTTRLDQLANLDLHAALQSLIEPGLRNRLDTLAPSHVEVPSGSRLAIDYSDPGAPAIEVRLQEMFGQLSTPKLGGGRVPLTIRLLSPAMRPVQVTRDLESFWKSGYFEVRKDLRGRYPKHYWPDDPLTAVPTRRTRPRP